ncbi:tRNA methyltransferase ppm2 [Neurospora sp. IMI 360204]|nr:tRNA methyltransferase ppm2 [Neurospora sp. IMI 360204]
MDAPEEVTPAITQQQPAEAEAAPAAKVTYTKKQKKPKTTTDGTSTTHNEHAKDPRKAQDDQVMGSPNAPSKNSTTPTNLISSASSSRNSNGALP